jgi:hypothetical protein
VRLCASARLRPACVLACTVHAMPATASIVTVVHSTAKNISRAARAYASSASVTSPSADSSVRRRSAAPCSAKRLTSRGGDPRVGDPCAYSAWKASWLDPARGMARNSSCVSL